SRKVFVTGASPGVGTGDDIATLAYDTSLIGITPPPPVPLTSVVSRKVHGSSGLFDIDLSGGNGIECRSGGSNGDYALVFTFANPLSNVGGASVTAGMASVSSNAIGSDPHQYVVNLTGVTNAQKITV